MHQLNRFKVKLGFVFRYIDCLSLSIEKLTRSDIQGVKQMLTGGGQKINRQTKRKKYKNNKKDKKKKRQKKEKKEKEKEKERRKNEKRQEKWTGQFFNFYILGSRGYSSS